MSAAEQRIIERDAAEQRALSAELNGRASLLAALIAIAGAMAVGVELHIGVQILVTPILLVTFVLMWRLARGEDYSYPKLEADWVRWIDSRNGPAFRGEKIEEMADAYYRALMASAMKARESNRRKAESLAVLGPIPVAVIILILIVNFMNRLSFQ